MIRQTTFTLRPREKGCHLVTDEILARLPELPETGLLHLFISHTSAGLTLNFWDGAAGPKNGGANQPPNRTGTAYPALGPAPQ